MKEFYIAIGIFIAIVIIGWFSFIGYRIGELTAITDYRQRYEEQIALLLKEHEEQIRKLTLENDRLKRR